MRELVITKYRVANGGKYVLLETEIAGQREQLSFCLKPGLASGLGLDLIMASMLSEVREKRVKGERQG